MSEERNKLFRQESLAALNSNSETSEYARVTRPSTVVLLAALVACCIVATCWCAFGTVNLKITATGVSFPHAGLQSQSLPFAGRVMQVRVGHGSHVEQGTPLLTVATDVAQSTLTAEREGVVLSFKQVGNEFLAGEPVVYMLPQSGATSGREIIALVQYKDLRWLKPGLQVQVTPADLTREDYGYATGKVSEIDPYPISREEAKEQLRLDQFGDAIFPEGTAYEVKIVLDADADGRLKWSRQKSSHLRFPVGSFCQVQIVTRNLKVWQVIMLKLHSHIDNLYEK